MNFYYIFLSSHTVHTTLNDIRNIYLKNFVKNCISNENFFICKKREIFALNLNLVQDNNETTTINPRWKNILNDSQEEPFRYDVNNLSNEILKLEHSLLPSACFQIICLLENKIEFNLELFSTINFLFSTHNAVLTLAFSNQPIDSLSKHWFDAFNANVTSYSNHLNDLPLWNGSIRICGLEENFDIENFDICKCESSLSKLHTYISNEKEFSSSLMILTELSIKSIPDSYLSSDIYMLKRSSNRKEEFQEIFLTKLLENQNLAFLARLDYGKSKKLDENRICYTSLNIVSTFLNSYNNDKSVKLDNDLESVENSYYFIIYHSINSKISSETFLIHRLKNIEELNEEKLLNKSQFTSQMLQTEYLKEANFWPPTSKNKTFPEKITLDINDLLRPFHTDVQLLNKQICEKSSKNCYEKVHDIYYCNYELEKQDRLSNKLKKSLIPVESHTVFSKPTFQIIMPTAVDLPLKKLKMDSSEKIKIPEKKDKSNRKAIKENSCKIELNQNAKKESRTVRNKRKLANVISSVLLSIDIDEKNVLFKNCFKRLFTISETFVKDLPTSFDLKEQMKKIAESHLKQTVDFEVEQQRPLKFKS